MSNSDVRNAGSTSFADFKLRKVARTSSTQDVIRRAAQRGVQPGFCCVADEQTAGRGRQGRSWFAPGGTALLCSILLEIPTEGIGGVPLAAGLSVHDAIMETADIHVDLKWPNDVLARGRKLAGLLGETVVTPDGSRLAALGLGLNLTVPGFPPPINGISLHELIENPPSRDRLLAAWLRSLKQRLDRLTVEGIAGLRNDWRRAAVGLGTSITVSTAAGPVRGIAMDIDDDGALVVKTGDGVRSLVAGEVHIGLPVHRG